MRKYLVTGGAGFIGSNLVRRLLEDGEAVAVIDNFSTGRRENIEDVMGDIELVEGDIRDADAVARAIRGCSGVFHQAALGSVPRSVEDPGTSHDVNVGGTLAVLEAARAAGVARVLFAGSSSVYGNREESPKHEDMRLLPESPYAATKVAAEAYVRAWARTWGMETMTLRYFNVFGPRQDPAGPYAAVIPAFVSSLMSGQRPVVYGGGRQSRDFCFIENVCNANLLAMRAPAAVCDGRAVNIACGQSTSLLEILGYLGEIFAIDSEPAFLEPRPGDVKHSLADISRATESIGYRPAVFVQEGLKRSVAWYREHC